MQQISKALIQSAQILGNAFDPTRITKDKIKTHYQKRGNLQQWVKAKRTELINLCADPDTCQVFETWIQPANNAKEIIPELAKIIAIYAIPDPPEFTPDTFPMFDDPAHTIPQLLAEYRSTWENARIEYENLRVAAGEDIADVQGVAADQNASTAAAAAGSPGTAAAAAPVYVAIPAAFAVTGNQSTGDYMEQLAALGYSFQLNTVTNRIEVNGEDKTDSIESEIYLAMRDRGYKGRATIADCINVVAKQNEYHPIKNYLTSLTWDGTEVLDQFVSLLHPTDPVYAGVIFRKWMISVVAKIMERKQNSMLVMEGDQGSGKSYFARWLCPLPKYFKESAIQPDNKDHEIAACSKWLWEVKELSSTTRRADQDALKGFLTAEEFNFRPAYARNDITRPSLVSYIGTVNNSSGFLVDVTGNRRFWTIGTGDIDWSYATIYKPDDLWAEAYARWKRGDMFTLTPDENKSLTENQEQYKVINMTAEAMQKYFDIDPDKVDDPGWCIPVIDVRETLKQNGLSEADVNARRIGDAAKELQITSKKVKRSGKTITVYQGLKLKSVP